MPRQLANEHAKKLDEQKKRHKEILEKFCQIFDNTYLIDLFTYAPEFDAEFEKRFYMGGHMTPAGYSLTAKMMESYIDYIIRKYPDDFKQVGFIGTDLFYKAEN